jgi:hypothetical protein
MPAAPFFYFVFVGISRTALREVKGERESKRAVSSAELPSRRKSPLPFPLNNPPFPLRLSPCKKEYKKGFWAYSVRYIINRFIGKNLLK